MSWHAQYTVITNHSPPVTSRRCVGGAVLQARPRRDVEQPRRRQRRRLGGVPVHRLGDPAAAERTAVPVGGRRRRDGNGAPRDRGRDSRRTGQDRAVSHVRRVQSAVDVVGHQPPRQGHRFSFLGRGCRLLPRCREPLSRLR